MKKIITTLIAVAAFAAVHAQTSRDDARRVILGQPKQTTSQQRKTQQGRTVILGNPQTQQSGRVYKTNRNVNYGKNNNHGKHLGWYKGKGNPHRYGMSQGRGKKSEHERHEGRDRDDD
jgi:Ni/Co efflux regulator RcnB